MYKGSQYDLLSQLGRKSIAEGYYEETSEEEEGEEGTWLVLYDFRSKPNPRFWGNVKRLIGLVGEGSLVQYSVFMTKSRRGAVTAVKIARHYGAHVMLFRGEEIPY